MSDDKLEREEIKGFTGAFNGFAILQTKISGL